MTSTTGDRLESTTLLSRRLSLLPAILGLVAIVVITAAGRFVLPEEPEWPRTAMLIAVFAVAITVVSGYPVGMYAGLGVYAVAMVGGNVADSITTLVVATAAPVVAHELLRVSVDARRPTRFGPRFWLRFALRTVALVLCVGALVLFAQAIADAALPTWLVPAAIALAALPLLAHRLVGRWPVVVSVVFALLVAAVTMSAAVLGSTARSQIERSPVTTTAPSTDDGSTTSTTDLQTLTEPSPLEPVVAILLFVVTMLVVGAILVALRRREMTFDLDELDMELEDHTLGFAGPGQADVEDDRVEIDEEAMDRLLAELALDISSERDAGRAVRFAYANIERSLSALGVAREESETEQEYLTRAIPALGEDGAAMVQLTALFERARFGHQPISEQMRTEALAAVDRLRAVTTQPGESIGGEGP